MSGSRVTQVWTGLFGSRRLSGTVRHGGCAAPCLGLCGGLWRQDAGARPRTRPAPSPESRCRGFERRRATGVKATLGPEFPSALPASLLASCRGRCSSGRGRGGRVVGGPQGPSPSFPGPPHPPRKPGAHGTQVGSTQQAADCAPFLGHARLRPPPRRGWARLHGARVESQTAPPFLRVCWLSARPGG